MSIMFKRGHSFGAFSVSHDSHNRDLDTFIRSSMKSDYFPENIEQFFKWKSEEYAKSLGDKKCRS